VVRPLILAHRGDWTNAPENSLPAFAAATERPDIDGVEFDVRAAHDGTPVVVHDADLLRVQGVDETVGSMSAADLRSLGIADLATVLGALPDPFFLDVELKEDVGADVVPLLARMRGDPPRHAVVSSFSLEILARVRALVPHWPMWLISTRFDETVLQSAEALGCRGLAIEWPALDRDAVSLVRTAGLELATWTVEDRATLRQIVRLGVDAICIDPMPASRVEVSRPPSPAAARADRDR
jgi:glycerophosphoryl diester phosphodiesterase